MGGRGRQRLAALAVIAVLGAVLAACGDDRATQSVGVATDVAPQIRAQRADSSRPVLTDAAAERGLEFTHGAFRWQTAGDPVAMMGGGLCWLDMDDDGWLDLYAVNAYAESESRRWDDKGGRPVNGLFRNDGGQFTDVSVGSGADLSVRGNGCVAADFDLDGVTDLFVTTSRANALLWGEGDGRFSEGAAAAGLDAYEWHTGAAVGDVDGDGWPDLFVSGYVDLNLSDPTATQGFPNTYGGVRDLLYLSNGPGPDGRVTFREVGEELGIDPGEEYGLGALLTDVDQDQDLDLYVANDTNPNRLYLNEAGSQPADPGDLGFALREVGATAAVADVGSGMGVAGDDYDGDGRGDLFVTNFGDQTHALFENETAGPVPSFVDGLPGFGVEDLGVGVTGWGTGFVDLDLDTDLDLLVANGLVPVTDLEADAQEVSGHRNLTVPGPSGGFEESGEDLGLDEVGPINGRGLAPADFDNDGDMDAAVSAIGGPLVLLENRGAAGNWLEVATASFAPGAVVTVLMEDGRELRREMHAGSSYLSSVDPRAHFGLGEATTVAEVRVTWPAGGTTVVDDVDANQVLVLAQEDP